MKPIRTLAIVVNKSKSGAMDLAQWLASTARENGTTVVITDQHPIPNDFLNNQEACCAIGGDGTLLGIVNEALQFNTPVFGVNQGKLGFLATLSAEEACHGLQTLLQGHYQISRRSLLACRTTEGQERLALNDVVIKEATGARLTGLEVLHNGRLANHYFADGLIFSTSTGSTAYNLSAGGPIIHPYAQALAMTPICPHTLSNRSVIFPLTSVLQVDTLTKPSEIHVAVDGHVVFQGQKHFPMTLSTATQMLSILQPLGYSHFHILREKLQWGSYTKTL